LTRSSHPVFAVITGGGTSGHVIPALAIAELLQDAGVEISQMHFVGSVDGVETTLVPPTGLAMSLLSVQGFVRRFSPAMVAKNLRTLRRLLVATKQAEILLEGLSPKVVVSVGGYASVPATRAANRLGIPVVAVSYDSQPGRATKMQSRRAATTAVAYLPSRLKNAVLTGAPVRRVLRNLDLSQSRDEARKKLGLPSGRRVICVTGGSLGSARLNAVAREIVQANQHRDDLCVIHLTGKRYLDADIPQLETNAKIVYRRLDTTTAMQDVYSATDLLVARAGASTIAEIATIGIASVIVPWSQAAEDHQTMNAVWLGDRSAAIVIDERANSTTEIAEKVVAVIDDRTLLESLAKAAHQAGVQHRNTTLAFEIIRASGSAMPVDLSKSRRIHVVGVGGPGMSAIATVLAEMKHSVSGSDIRQTDSIDRLRKVGVAINVPHRASVVDDCDFVTGSPAIPETNIEFQRARDGRIRLLSRAEILAAICSRATSIGVAGTHGKTTTSSMLTAILKTANLNPNYLIGGDVHQFGRGASWTGGSLFVVEADESDGTHSQLPLSGTILTNVDVDHLDHFKSVAAIEKSFERFVKNIRGPRVLCADDPVCARIAQICDATTYSIVDDSSADYQAGEIKFADGGATFDVSTRSGSMLRRLGRVHIAQRGLHNVSNAMAAIAMAMKLGVEFEDAASGLAKFGGVARRFDVRGKHDGVTFVDDYAHLPAEISAVLAGLGDGTDTWSRVVAVFQPNRFNRMAQISHLYADSFEQADLVVVTDIYSSGTSPIAGVTGQLVVDAIRAAHPDCNVVYQPQRGDLVEFLAGELKSGDICISMGCGDIESLPEEVIARRKR